MPYKTFTLRIFVNAKARRTIPDGSALGRYQMTLVKLRSHPPKHSAIRWGYRLLGIVVMIAGAALFYRFLSLGWAGSSAFPDSSEAQRRVLGLLGMPIVGLGLQLFLAGAGVANEWYGELSEQPADDANEPDGGSEPSASTKSVGSMCPVCGLSFSADTMVCSTCAEVQA